MGIPKDILETKSIIAPWIQAHQETPIKNYTFAIEQSNSQEFIGLIGLKLGSVKYNRAEVWYKLLPSQWNQGFATQALKTLISFGFDHLHLHRIEAGCAIGNIASIKVLEKTGMIREAHRRAILPLVSGWSDNYEYAILETDSMDYRIEQ